jgi:mannose-1-phosphate guanylyltransferase/mannose-6-phosphate isomerase-like protein (cupin superfamily)
MSRETCPKQMLRIAGEDTLLRETIKRISGLVLPENTWIVTTEDKAQDIRIHIDSMGPMARGIRFISEPLGRNTAPAIGLAAVYLNRVSPESVMVVMPSDHAIPDAEKFLAGLRLAVEGAKEDHLMTFGIRPTRPETGYGYIKTVRSSEIESRGLFKVERFFEKPDFDTARTYVSNGNYFWNSGIFVWKTSTILLEIEAHLPDLYKTLRKIESLIFGSVTLRSSDPKTLRPYDSATPQSLPPATQRPYASMTQQCSELYAEISPISIDYGIMERSQNSLMVPAEFQWSDLGSWTALDEIMEKDGSGNILKGNTVDLGSRDSTVFAGDRLIATIGLKEMVVVDTPDATLIAPKEKVQEVRKIVEELKRTRREEHLLHKTVERPWGSYTVLEKGEGYKIKRIVLKPKARLSLQLHRRRSEHWVVAAGSAKVTRAEETFLVHTSESTYIPVHTKHRLENPGDLPLRIIEVQNGEYLEEDDIERFSDDYGRS